MKLNKKGFTLVEVVIVLTVMALLAVAALPRIIAIITQAKRGARDHVVAAVREGIFLYRIGSVSESNPVGSYTADNQLTSNAANATCNNKGGTACFDGVLEAGQQISDSRWSQTGANTYTYDQTGSMSSTFTYNSTQGTFICSSGTPANCAGI